MKKIILILILFISLFELSGRQPQSLSLTECIELGHRKSSAAKIVKKTYESQMFNYRAFKSGFLPQVSFRGSAPGLNRGINSILQPDGALLFKPQSNLTSMGILSVNQKAPLTGAEISVSSSIRRIDVLENNENFMWMTSPLQIFISQPIFSVNRMKWDREIEKERSVYYNKLYSAAMESISINVTTKFFNLYISQMNVRNAELNSAINDTLFQLSKGRFEVGKIAENDLLHSELELANANSSLINAKLNVQKAEDELKLALGFDTHKEIMILPPEGIEKFDIDLNLAIDIAKRNSSELMNLKINKTSAERDLELAESRNSFNATITASYGLNQTTGRFNQVYKDLLDQETLNLDFSMPLFQWGKGSSEIEAALAAQLKAESELELNQKEFDIRLKYEILLFLQLKGQTSIAERSNTIASRRFEVAKNRYMIGKIDMNALFLAQREKDSALINYFQTLKDYWVSYYTIRKLTLYDFVKNDDIKYSF